ncbi:MAG: hypothetical protein U0401_27830 [Anaerolineae bacterium]
MALLTDPKTGALGPLSPVVFFPLVFVVSFVAGGLWAGLVGVLRGRGGNEVLVS